MSTTVGTLEKKVETVFETLTPAEKAKYVYDETWRSADRQAKGIDEETHQQEIERFFHRHVATLSATGYIEFLIAQDRLNTGKWAGMYFASTLMGYDREDALIDLLIRYAGLTKSLIRGKCAKKDKLHAAAPGMDEMINGFRERQAAIIKDAKGIWKDGFWEQWNIPRPDLSPDFIKAIETDDEPSEKAEPKNS
jgi:peroxiredoxin family protein